MLTNVWGPLAPILASMIASQPNLGRRLALSPGWAIHSTAAYIHAMVAGHRSKSEIADAINTRRPRELLTDAVPNAHVSLRSALKRVGDQVHEPAFYYRLNELLHGPAADVVVRATMVTAGLLSVAEMISADPVLMAAHCAIDGSLTDANSFAEVLRFLRAMGHANEIEALPPGSGWQAIVHRCKADLAHAKAPPAPFSAPAGWSVVTSLGQLFAIGERMEDCVAGIRFGGDHHLIELMSGRSFYLATIDDPSVLATIRNIGPKMWTFGEVSIRGKRQALTEARASLTAHLTARAALVGHEFFESCPVGILSGFSMES